MPADAPLVPYPRLAPRGRTLMDDVRESMAAAARLAADRDEQLQRRTEERDFLDKAVQKAAGRIMELEAELDASKRNAADAWLQLRRVDGFLTEANDHVRGLEGTIANQATLIAEQGAIIVNRDEKLAEMVGLCDEQALVIRELREMLTRERAALRASQDAASAAKWAQRVAESNNDTLGGIVGGLQQRLKAPEQDVADAQPEEHQDMWPSVPAPSKTTVRFLFVETTGDPADLGIEDAAELLAFAAERAG